MKSWTFTFLNTHLTITLGENKIVNGQTQFDDKGRIVKRSRKDAINEVIDMVGPGNRFQVVENN